LVLIFLMLTAYFTFFRSAPQPDKQKKEVQQEVKTDVQQRTPQQISPDAKQYGKLANALKGNAVKEILENDDIKVTFSSKGGFVERVALKKYKTHDKKPLIFLDKQSSQIQCLLKTKEGEIDLAQLHFTPTRKGNKLIFKLALDEQNYIQQTYTLGKTGHQIDYNLQVVGLKEQLVDDKAQWIWKADLKKTEENLELSRMKSTINYYIKDEGFDYLSETSTSKEDDEVEQGLNWVSFQQKFFLGAIIAKGDYYFPKGYVATEVDEDRPEVVKSYETRLEMPISQLQAVQPQYKFYFGPNQYKVLNKVTEVESFERNVGLGGAALGWVNQLLIIPIFNFLEHYVSNYGLLIFLLVVIIKTLLFPLVYRSYLSTAKMRVLKPELDKIKEKHDGDMQKMQAEQMELYRQVGINPLSGCIPMVLQMPILFSMFIFFPNAIELRQESFLWAHDLSTYDSIVSLPFEIPFYGDHVSLFTILMTISSIAYTWYNNQNSVQMQGPMQAVGYFMPLIFMFVLNSYPAGLTFYYFSSTVVSIAQQLFIRGLVNDEKIEQKLAENKRKNKDKKPGGFQRRLEEAMKAKAQQEQQKGNKNKKNTKISTKKK
ncbi:MAG: membrane protein insertase YidC, partial [Bacteroidota bacterium]